jgi:hypothetical protein
MSDQINLLQICKSDSHCTNQFDWFFCVCVPGMVAKEVWIIYRYFQRGVGGSNVLPAGGKCDPKWPRCQHELNLSFLRSFQPGWTELGEFSPLVCFVCFGQCLKITEVAKILGLLFSTCMYHCMYSCINVCTYICINVCTYVSMYINVCIHLDKNGRATF